MRKIMCMMLLLTAAALTSACSNDDEIESTGSYDTDSTADGSGSLATGSSDLLTFAVAIDKSTAEPATTASAFYPEAEDNLSDDTNSGDFDTTVSIDVSNPTTGTINDVVEVSNTNGNIVCNHGSNKVCYVLSGSTASGSVTIMGDKKCKVTLNGVSITSPDSAALNVLCKKRCFLYVADGTENTLQDTKCSSSNEHKGALYCKGKLLVHGTGALNVYGNHRNGIHSADYIIFNQGNNIYVKTPSTVTENGHGIKANDGIFINGGIINVEVAAAAAKGINCEDSVIVRGGRTTVVTTGGGAYEDSEAKGSAGIKSDTSLTMYDGEVNLQSSGAGGKGVSTDGIFTMNGGTLRVITSGGQYSSGNDTASPKGIKCDNNICLNGGSIKVRTSGRNGEGIESKAKLYIAGGTVQVSAYDDGINSKSDMSISGGSITTVGNNSDGVDSNGNLYISGGNLTAMGASGAETGIDVGENCRLYVTGGSFIGIGGRIDCSIGSTTQGICSTSGSVQANSTVTVSKDGSTLSTFIMPPYSYNNGAIMVSAAGMNSNNTYTIALGTSTVTATASTSVSSGMGGGGGGGLPGWGGRW